MQSSVRSAPRTLTSEQVASYHDKGYVVVKNAVTAEQLEMLRQVVDGFIEQSRGLTESTSVLDLEPEHTPEDPKVRRIRTPIVLHEIFREVALTGKIPAMVADLIGPNVKFHHNKVNVKVGGGGSEAKWHQDYPFTPHTNVDFCAAAVALDDATLENGCVFAVPGSHRGRAYSHYLDDSFVGYITEEFPPGFLASAEPMELRAGDVSIHHCIAVHGSSRNTSPKQRRLLINQYAAADAMALTYNTSTTQYDGHIVAGEPSRFARMEAGLVLLPPDFSKQGYRSVFSLQQAAPPKATDERILREF